MVNIYRLTLYSSMKGATLGGTVADKYVGVWTMALSAVCVILYLGVRFVDGQGRYIRSGGKVVKERGWF